MKAIILGLDEKENAHISKIGNVEPLECFHSLVAAAILFYKEIHDIDSIDEAIKGMGLDLLESVAR